jgi:hypothetical protein
MAYFGFNLYSPNIPGIIPGLGITGISPRSPEKSQGPEEAWTTWTWRLDRFSTDFFKINSGNST